MNSKKSPAKKFSSEALGIFKAMMHGGYRNFALVKGTWQGKEVDVLCGIEFHTEKVLTGKIDPDTILDHVKSGKYEDVTFKPLYVDVQSVDGLTLNWDNPANVESVDELRTESPTTLQDFIDQMEEEGEGDGEEGASSESGESSDNDTSPEVAEVGN